MGCEPVPTSVSMASMSQRVRTMRTLAVMILAALAVPLLYLTGRL